jgi:hypothetical protein
MSKYSHSLTDYLKSINETKTNLMDTDDPGWEKNYPSWIINKCLSSFIDTIMFANEMNMLPDTPKKMQYDFYIHTIRKRKRFSPWEKKEKLEDLEVIKEYYNYSTEKAQAVLKILNSKQIDYIKSKLNRGGKT